MKKVYDIHGGETLLTKVVEAVKRGEEYVPQSLRQFGKRYVFEMENDEVIEDVGSVSVVEQSEEDQESVDNTLGIKSEIDSKTKKELVEYIEGFLGEGETIDGSLVKPELRQIAYKHAGLTE